MDTKIKKRKCQKIITDSTDSEPECEIGDHAFNPKRKSQRLLQKRDKPKFKMPTRDEIWEEIPSSKDVSKLKDLTPRKTTNNFTKIYNDYNFDDYEDTSDSVSSEESSDMSSEEISEDDSQTGPSNQRKKHRIKNFYTRIVKKNSSDEDDSTEINDTSKTCATTNKQDLYDREEKESGDIESVSENSSFQNDDEDMNNSLSRKRSEKKKFSFLDSDDDNGS